MATRPASDAVKVFSFFVGLVVAIALTSWFNSFLLFILALIAGIAGGIIVYRLLVNFLANRA